MFLGEYKIEKKHFADAPAAIQKLKKISGNPESIRNQEVNQTLLQLIQNAEEPCFLLSSVLDFIHRIDQEQILEGFHFSHFELWLNQFSGLSFKENLHIRGKIVGKLVERSDYQAFFPIGMGKVYPGTHFVTAHKSPDLDTTIASFWGWIDAFAARVGDALHVWNLPGGPPSSQIEVQWIFSDLFGSAVFSHLPKTRNALNLTGMDLLTRAEMAIKTAEDSIVNAEHEEEQGLVVVVDQEGFYLDDWRSLDVEEVRGVIILLSSCLRWFENQLHLHLISLFAKPKLTLDVVKPSLEELFHLKISHCDPAKEFNAKQKAEVSKFIALILKKQEGLSLSFEELGLCLASFAKLSFSGIDQLLNVLKPLFDAQGHLKENREAIFAFLEMTIRELHKAILKIRNRMEKLDVALETKKAVFGHLPSFVSLPSDVEEIRQKMGAHLSLTVTSLDQEKLFPLGVISAQAIRNPVLGTVSLRDFCNREEMTIPPYLDVISVIDHHKSHLQTLSPPFAIIADAQSSNCLVARQAFLINDRYSVGVQTEQDVDAQIAEELHKKDPISRRVLQRLFEKKNRFARQATHFVHKDREYVEYLHFLYGILDDTDLLSKVSSLDVECVANLLNRMKTLVEGKEVEIISLDDLPRDAQFPKKAATRILQNEDMYSLYSKVYSHREKEVASIITEAAGHKTSHFFADTKTQNGCCRIGQTKIFASNVSLFAKHAKEVQNVWLQASMRVNEEHPEVDLHMHMMSTIVSAEEVYRGGSHHYSHKDELWLWIPEQEVAIEHLKKFLLGFQSCPGLKNNPLEIEFLGDRAEEFKALFRESFLDIPYKISKAERSFVILKYSAGSLNSRKAMIAPFLPHVVV